MLLAGLGLLVLAVFESAVGAAFTKKLKDLAAKTRDGVLELDDSLFEQFQRLPKDERNLHLVVLYNTLDPAHGCQLCEGALRLFKDIVKSYRAQVKRPAVPVFFAQAQAASNQKGFFRIGLNRVPTLAHYGPASDGQPTFFKMDNPGDFANYQKFIAESTGNKFTYRPTGRQNLHQMDIRGAVILAAAVLGGLVYFKIVTLSGLLQSTAFWSVLCIGFVVLMESGFMWVRLRNAPYLASKPDGKPMYFAHGLQAQFGLESRIVSLLLAWAAGMFVATPWAVKLAGSGRRQPVAALTMSCAWMAGHALLLKLFCQKLPNYTVGYLF